MEQSVSNPPVLVSRRCNTLPTLIHATNLQFRVARVAHSRVSRERFLQKHHHTQTALVVAVLHLGNPNSSSKLRECEHRSIAFLNKAIMKPTPEATRCLGILASVRYHTLSPDRFLSGHRHFQHFDQFRDLAQKREHAKCVDVK